MSEQLTRGTDDEARGDGASSSVGARDLIRTARGHELGGRLGDAGQDYEAAVAAAERESDDTALSEALRRLAVIHFRRHEPAMGRDCCNRSLAVAQRIGDNILAADALNPLGTLGSSEALRTSSVVSTRRFPASSTIVHRPVCSNVVVKGK